MRILQQTYSLLLAIILAKADYVMVRGIATTTILVALSPAP